MKTLSSFFENVSSLYLEAKAKKKKEKNKKINSVELVTAALVQCAKEKKNLFDIAVQKKTVGSIRAAARAASKYSSLVSSVGDRIGDAHLAQALSAAMKIVEIAGSLQDYQVLLVGDSSAEASAISTSLSRVFSAAPGKNMPGWAGVTGLTKDYNSSDIVLHDSAKKKSIGFSLKAKASINQKSPTMINAPVHGYMRVVLPSDVLEDIAHARVEFFERVLKIKQKGELKSRQENVRNAIASLDEKYEQNKKNIKKSGKDYIKEEERPSVKLIAPHIISEKNTYFKKIHDAIVRHKTQIVNQILVDALRLGMSYFDDVKNFNFSFYVLTAIGSAQKNSLVVHEAKALRISSLFNKFQKHLSAAAGSSFDLVPYAKQPFSPGSKSSEINFDIKLAQKPIATMTIRYKGRYSTSPEIQLKLTKEFDEMFGD